MNKISKVFNTKVIGNGKEATPEQLAQINKFSLVDLKPEQVYVRRFLMCHNAIDRDRERFNEILLEDFAKTLPGKGFFVEGHPSSWSGKGGPGEGRFFNAMTEMMTPEQFKKLTHEDCVLPENVKQVKVLWADAYTLKLESNADTLAKIDAGIYCFASIGFNAPLMDVTDERGNMKYGEYQSKGEALEGSLVWLGAQPGAAAQKCADCKNNKEGSMNQAPTKKEGAKMEIKDFIKNLSVKIGKTFSDEPANAEKEILSLLSEKDEKIKALEPEANDGKMYRKSLVEDALRFGALVEEISSDIEKQKTDGEFIATWPIARIKDLKDKYEVKAREKFPDKFTFKGKDEDDRKKKDAEGKKKEVKTGKKDYTSPETNELLN